MPEIQKTASISSVQTVPAVNSPAEEQVSSRVSEAAQNTLEQADLDHFKLKLYEKYSQKVVDALFSQVVKRKKTSLTAGEAKRFDLLCHYLEIETNAKKQIYKKHSPENRLLNRFLRYSRAETYNKLLYRPQGTTLTHEALETYKKNLEVFKEYETNLVEDYGESICHRSLTRDSIVTGKMLLGLEPMLSFEGYKDCIETHFGKEIQVRERLETTSQQELFEKFDDYKAQIMDLKETNVIQELFHQLLIKSGHSKLLIGKFDSFIINQQAELFEASRMAGQWAEEQTELIPIPGSGGKESQGQVNQNVVYFLKDSNPEKPRNIAVFKDSKAAGAMETLVYDVSILFGLSETLVPTKLKKVQDKLGSIQIFQNGLDWTHFSQKEPTEQNEIIQNISMDDFLKAGFAALLFGNRDLHVGNFFFVPKENGAYKIAMFDNEESFRPSNYILIDRDDHCHLPVRNALLIFPQADKPISGHLKIALQNWVQTWTNRFQEFLKYLESPSGKTCVKNLRKQKLNYYQIKAFKERIEKIQELLNRDKDYSYRDLVYRVFPLYHSFYKLTQFLYPDHPEMMVGYHPAENLCDEVIKLGYMTEEKKANFIEEIKKYADK